MATPVPVTMKLHSAVAKAFIDNGVDIMFGLIGDGNLYMADAFVREYGGRFVDATHEANATLMGLGHATVSGKVSVVTVTHGPGVTNTLTALVEGVKSQTPLVLLCGDTDVTDRENFQNVAQRELILATGAGFEQLRAPQTAMQDVATALRRARLERRPVALNVPVDFQWKDVDYLPVIAKLPDNRAIVPSSTDLDDAVGIIAAAKRPIIVAGRGATGPAARSALIRLARRIDALLATTLKGKGLFQGEDFNLGIFGTLSHPFAVDAIIESDCIISFGASLNKWTTSDGSFLRGKRVVQINLEQSEVGKIARPDAGLVGDPALIADQIIHWLDEAEIPASGFRSEELNARLSQYKPDFEDKSTDRTMDVRKAMQHVNRIVPADRVLVTDAGRFQGAPLRLIDVPDPRSYVFTVHFGSIGLGMSYAIGASYAAPGRPVLLVTGDGGFMLGGLTEFNTAVRHKLDLIVVVCNDCSYGAEHIQFREKNMDPKMSVFDWPDFATVATALGGTGLTVRTEADFEAVARTVRDRNGPMLIDVKCDPDRMPPRGGGA